MADQIAVRRWLSQLGRLTTAKVSAAEVTDFLDAFAPMLASRFDDGAFTAASLDHVAGQCKYLPTYGELVPLLAAWWRKHRPQPPAVTWQPAPDRERPSDEEFAHVSKAVRGIVAELLHRDAEANARQKTPYPPAPQMSRAELTEAYRRAGLQGPPVDGALYVVAAMAAE